MSGAIETGCKKRGGVTETPAAGDGFRRNAGSRPAMIGAGGAGGTRSQSGKRRDAGISAVGRRMRRDCVPSSDGGSRFAVPVSARKPACNRYATHTNGRRVSGWMTICRGTEAALRLPAEPWDSHAVLQAGKQRPLRGACCRCGFLRGRGYSHSANSDIWERI